jgi:hypothetical protein
MCRASTILVLASVTFASFALGDAVGSPAALRPGELATTEAVLRWINVYRTRRDLAHVPAAIRALSELGALRDPENSAVYVGFIAGIIGSNPGKADELSRYPQRTTGRWCAASPIRARRAGRTRSPTSPNGCRAAG